MLKEKPGTVSGIARVVDLTALGVSFAAGAALCRSHTLIEPLGWLRGTFPVETDVIHQYALLLVLAVIAWIAITHWRGSYHSHRSEHLWRFLRGHLTTELIWVMAVGTLAFLFKLSHVSRAFFLTFLPLSMLILSARQLGARV